MTARTGRPGPGQHGAGQHIAGQHSAGQHRAQMTPRADREPVRRTRGRHVAPPAAVVTVSETPGRHSKEGPSGAATSIALLATSAAAVCGIALVAAPMLSGGAAGGSVLGGGPLSNP